MCELSGCISNVLGGKWNRRSNAGGLTQRINVVMVRPSQSQMLKVRKQHTEMKKRSEGTNSTVEPPTHITACPCKYTEWLWSRHYPILPKRWFSHRRLWPGTRTEWRWTRTSRRTPLPRSGSGERIQELQWRVQLTERRRQRQAQCNERKHFLTGLGFTFLKTSGTEALAGPFSSCSSDRKACLVTSASVSTALASASAGASMAWPASLPFSTVLLSAKRGRVRGFFI